MAAADFSAAAFVAILDLVWLEALAELQNSVVNKRKAKRNWI